MTVFELLIILLVMFLCGFACGWHVRYSSVLRAFGKDPSGYSSKLWKEYLNQK